MQLLKFTPSVDVPLVRQFLESKAKKSANTAMTYSSALSSFRRFLVKQYPQYDIETIVYAVQKQEVDLYKLFDDYVTYLPNKGQTPSVYAAAVKKYFAYYDVYIIPEKFKNRVTLPAVRQEYMPPLERDDLRKILLAITNRRLKAFCLCKASAGFRAVEGLSIQNKNLTFFDDCTHVYMKAQYSKNKLPREIYIAPEGTEELKRLIRFKYDTIDYEKAMKQHPDDYAFLTHNDFAKPRIIYNNFLDAFHNVLSSIGMYHRTHSDRYRHDITLHSLRAFVMTTIEDNTSANFADYILGHRKSTYYRHKEPERRKLYIEKCVEHLTFFDIERVERKVSELSRKNEEMLSNYDILMDALKKKGLL